MNNASRGFFFSSVKKIFLVFGSIAIASFIVAVLFPPFFDWLEAQTNQPLSYEQAIRWYFTGITILIWGRWTLQLRSLENATYRIAWIVVTMALIPLFAIFLLDQSHKLREEYSWIRYPTSLFLLLTSITIFLTLRGLKKIKKINIFFIFVGLSFFIASLDEILQIHEFIEDTYLERYFSKITSELITIGYGIIGIFLILFFRKPLSNLFVRQMPAVGLLTILAGVLFNVAMFFDTFDVIFHSGLRSIAKILAQNPHFFFSDVWYFLYEPRTLFNAFEEVFEYMAAALFFAVSISILKNRNHISDRPIDEKNPLIVRSNLNKFIITGLLISLAAAAPNALVAYSPLKTFGEIEEVVGPKDGLFHADDLFFHPSWGVVVGNEGSSKILIIQDGKVKQLLDPNHLFPNGDVMPTLTETNIYAAARSQGNILTYTEKNGWQEIASRKDGLFQPEGIVIVDRMIYGVDEAVRGIFRVPISGGWVEWYIPKHPSFLTPEGIAWHPALNRLLVTDDTTGNIFSVDFGNTLEIYANKKIGLSQPEDVEVLADGSVLVTDNGRGEILRFSITGSVLNRIVFHRMYRDLQGVTMDNMGNIYVVTGDGLGSVSFIPSYVLKYKFHTLAKFTCS